MTAGMLTGHFPDLDSCHSACQAAMGCGHDQECLCNCCDVGAMENDGCFCYSCGPMGGPQTLWSEHQNVKPRSNPLDSSEEPDQCTGTKQMCGGMFGSTSRDQETQAQKEARLEKQAEAARKEKAEMQRKMAEMEANAAEAQAAQVMAKKAISALQNVKDEAEDSKKKLDEKAGEVDDLENKLTKQNNSNESKDKEMALLKEKEKEQKAEIETMKKSKEIADQKAAMMEAKEKTANDHAHQLAEEIEKIDDAPSRAKIDAKLLESEIIKLKENPMVGIGPAGEPKELNNVQSVGEKLMDETLKKESEEKDENKDEEAATGSTDDADASTSEDTLKEK